MTLHLETLFNIPSHLISQKQDNIYSTTVEQFQIFYKAYKEFPLPNDILFPWLHGVNGNNSQQNLFFGVNNTSLVPNYRGLMLIHCDEIDSVSRLVESVLPEQILFMDLPNQYEFIDCYNQDVSINPRNFQIQISRFSTICDLVLYGSKAEEIASVLSLAQRKLYQQRCLQVETFAGQQTTNQILYRTIVIKDHFLMFEEKMPELIMYDSFGFLLNKRDFFELENVQLREMSQANEVTRNVWMGNTADVPVDEEDIHQFSICIEAHDLADMPTTFTLSQAKEFLKSKKALKPTEIIHFDAYSTGIPTQEHEFDEFYTQLIELFYFIQDQRDQHKVLIHCSDGYTETSLMGLTWIMFDQKLSLPEAYLYLQKYRSFFVHPTDVPSLRRIERCLLKDQESLEPPPKRQKNRVNMQVMKTNSDRPIERIYPWFFSPQFEGSFPSRILPFLYLGDLNHAMNGDMLKALNITHVVSVGEKAELNNQEFKLLYLDNLYDDGVDSIRIRLDSVIQFIEDARINRSQCLIHCRVGVSRSAALTICYVMKYLNYTLVQAYLFVRARRLNVIIQPNLKLMYEILQLEQEQKGSISISWPILCNEVYNLNYSNNDL